MTESNSSDPIADLWQARAVKALDREVFSASGVPDERRGLAVDVVTVLMKAGLPIADPQADVFDDRCGVALSVVPGPIGLALSWRQHPHMENEAGDAWERRQSAMHQALRAILSAQGYRFKDQPLGEAPIVIARTT
ncbi:hypothetical protein ACIGHB_29760 [Streptomyces sp. NPDC085460]|uniref:hypothetical protein n=1 Tax=Streptomyces sp. NPDC085460 TaxID=3365723 RepID=UPI0037D5D8DF